MSTYPLSKRSVFLMSVTAGLAVANTYYSQPVLKEIATTLHVPIDKTGILPALSIAGYGAGLFFLTPLGDNVNRKKLIILVQSLLITMLLAITIAQTYWQVCLLSLLIGFFSITAQLLIPMAAMLNSQTRAKTVSIIVTGLLTGMLAARTFSGYITVLFGWKYVYAISATLVLGCTLLLHKQLPNTGKNFTGNYIALLQSTVRLTIQLPLLRIHALLGALIFGTFCSFWTTLTLHLSGHPFNYKPGTIGLFSIVGISGVLATLVSGKFINNENITRVRLAAVFSIIVGVAMPFLFPFSILALLVTIVLLDVGVQATQLTNLATIYTLHVKAHSRINTIYMTLSFAGGAIGTVTGLICWKHGGWPLVLVQLICFSLAAFVTAWRLHIKRVQLRPQTAIAS